MLVLILALLAGCVPSLIVFFWLRNYLNKENTLYKKNCDRMLVSGFLTTFPVVLLSGCTAILFNALGVKSSHKEKLRMGIKPYEEERRQESHRKDVKIKRS